MFLCHLLGTEMTTLAQGKVGKHLDGLFLLGDDGFDEILDGDHALQFAVVVDQQQVTDVGCQHFLHAALDGVLQFGSHELACRCGNLLDGGVLGCAAQQCDLGDVVTLGDDSAQVATRIRGCQTTNIVGCKFLHSINHWCIFCDGVVNIMITTQFIGIISRHDIF